MSLKRNFNLQFKALGKSIIGLVYYYSGLVFLVSFAMSLVIPARKKVIILNYHGVDEVRLNIADNVLLARFAEQLDFIVKHFKIVPFNKAVNYLMGKGGAFTKPVAVLTFDDAYTSVFEKVYPLLKERNIPAITFTPVGLVGKPGNWERREKGYRGKIMDWNALKKLAEDGLIAIGSHGMTHQKLSTLSDDRIHKELFDSKTILESVLEINVLYFAYPYGEATECTPGIINELKKCGYVAACSTIWGRYSSPKNIFALRRIRIDYHDSMFDFKLKVKGAFDWIELFHVSKALLRRGRRT